MDTATHLEKQLTRKHHRNPLALVAVRLETAVWVHLEILLLGSCMTF
jgi:hypothetical protein